MNLLSINNKFVVAPYVSDGIIKDASTGGKAAFARIQQKVAIVGLRLLVDVLYDGLGAWKMGDSVQGSSEIPKMISAGSIIYIREEYLHTQTWAKQLLESDAIEGKFIIVDKQFVEFIHYA